MVGNSTSSNSRNCAVRGRASAILSRIALHGRRLITYSYNEVNNLSCVIVDFPIVLENVLPYVRLQCKGWVGGAHLFF